MDPCETVIIASTNGTDSRLYCCNSEKKMAETKSGTEFREVSDAREGPGASPRRGGLNSCVTEHGDSVRREAEVRLREMRFSNSLL